jgi:hypothetical protein
VDPVLKVTSDGVRGRYSVCTAGLSEMETSPAACHGRGVAAAGRRGTKKAKKTLRLPSFKQWLSTRSSGLEQTSPTAVSNLQLSALSLFGGENEGGPGGGRGIGESSSKRHTRRPCLWLLFSMQANPSCLSAPRSYDTANRSGQDRPDPIARPREEQHTTCMPYSILYMDNLR